MTTQTAITDGAFVLLSEQTLTFTTPLNQNIDSATTRGYIGMYTLSVQW
jgi:hypothetical protein